MTDFLEGDQDTGVQNTQVPNDDKLPVDSAAAAFVKRWTAKIKAQKRRDEKAFERMDRCMALAKDGAEKEWSENSENYVVPILNRLTNQAVAQLYAKNPQVYAKRKKRRMFTVWDGTIASLNEAEAMLKQAATMGQPLDPNAQAIMTDANTVKQYDTMMDGVGDTLTILHNHFWDDPAAQLKQQLKALVRRTKVCGVGYVKLCFQRVLQKNPDITVKLDQTTQQLAELQTLMAQKADGDIEEDSAKAEELKQMQADLQEQETLIVAEGPLYSFPRPKSIIIDGDCQQLKTLFGAWWYAEEFEKTQDDILTDYKVDVKGQFTEYKASDTEAKWERWSDEKGEMSRQHCAKVWRVMDRKTGLEFTICEGYPDYLKPPAAPDVKLSRFWDIFPLVFNEIESETDKYPPSDVWNARHLQAEYNRSRQGLREHRQQNRPGYFATKGTFEEADLQKISSHPSGAVIEVNTQLAQGESIADKLMAKPVMEIQPAQYDVEPIFTDILRVTGDQQANEGPTTTSTATESSIAEQSRSVGLADSVDDIDDLLSLLAQSTSEVMLLNISKQTVINIVGPGAVWPDMQQTREEIAEALLLDIRAGSSGRPNAPAELQKMQAAMPFIIQLPNVNPIPFTQKFLDLLDIDAEDAVVEGLPSIQAMNAMMQNLEQQGPQAAGPAAPMPSNAPAAQGPQGANNAPKPPMAPPAPMAPHPAPVPAGHMANGAPGGMA